MAAKKKTIKQTAKKKATKTTATKKKTAKKVAAKKAPVKKAAPKKTSPKKTSAPKKSVNKPKKLSITHYDRHQMIAEAAYLIAQSRNFCNGNETEDWLMAEQQVNEKLRGYTIV